MKDKDQQSKPDDEPKKKFSWAERYAAVAHLLRIGGDNIKADLPGKHRRGRRRPDNNRKRLLAARKRERQGRKEGRKHA